MPQRKKSPKRRKKRGTYRTNPISGQRERIPGKGERRNFLTGEIEKDPFNFNSPKKRARKPRKLTKSEQQAQKFAVLFVGVVFIGYVIYDWIVNNVFLASALFVCVVILLVLVFWKIPYFRKKLFGRFEKVFKIYGPIKDEEIKSLIKEIKSMNVQTVRDEEDFEKQLYQRLHAIGHELERQVRKEGRRIDLVINNKIAVELKIADRAKNIQDLIGQITIYSKYYRKIIVAILDYGRVQNLEEYIEHIQNIDRENIAVVVIGGDVKRRKKKEEYIMVKKSTGWE